MRASFIVNEIGIGLRRNLIMTIAMIITTAVSLGFLGTAVLFNQQVSVMKDFWYDKVEVSVFLCGADSGEGAAGSCAAGEVTQDQRDSIRADLDSMPAGPEGLLRVQARGLQPLQGAVQELRDRRQRDPRPDAGVVPGQAGQPRAVRHRGQRVRRPGRGRTGPGPEGAAGEVLQGPQLGAVVRRWPGPADDPGLGDPDREHDPGRCVQPADARPGS